MMSQKSRSIDKLAKLSDTDAEHDVLPIDGQHGVCRSYYQPDGLDLKALTFAAKQIDKSNKTLYALDLGCSPYFPQSQRLAKLGLHVDAFDLEPSIDTFDQINQELQNRISYHTGNIAKLTPQQLRTNYSIVYSNRCLSFLPYLEARNLIKMLVKHISCPSRFFLAFFSTTGDYAEGYPVGLPLKSRLAKLDNVVAKNNCMFAPVCLYTRDEVIEDLLGGLPIRLVQELQVKSGSIKLIFDIID